MGAKQTAWVTFGWDTSVPIGWLDWELTNPGWLTSIRILRCTAASVLLVFDMLPCSGPQEKMEGTNLGLGSRLFPLSMAEGCKVCSTWHKISNSIWLCMKLHSGDLSAHVHVAGGYAMM